MAFPFRKQGRLRCLGLLLCVVGSVAFPRKAFPVNPGFLNQAERVRTKSKLKLRDKQAASASFHGLLSGLLVGGEVRAITAARIVIRSGHDLSARVLPELSAVVPMEAKFCQSTGDLRRLFSLKPNPDPFPNHFGQFPKTRCPRLQ
jgi:hypothetical protein